MKGHKTTLLAAAGVALLVTGLTAEQAKPAAPVKPGASAQRPNDEGAAPSGPRKLVSPVRGVATVDFTQPAAKRSGEFVVTTFRVKNTSMAPIAGFKVDEFWYDKGGNVVASAQTFRQRSPIQPGEVINVELKVPVNTAMARNQYKFAHANGDVKPNKVAKL